MSGQRGQQSFVDQLESLLVHARALELALEQERRKTRSLQEEVSGAHSMFDRLMSEQKKRSEDLTVENSRLGTQLLRREETERALRGSVEELRKYQKAWASVLEREREAKTIIEENRRSIEKSRELEQRCESLARALEAEKISREQSERHAQGYQAELQSALVRLHSSETRFGELSKEFQTLRESRKGLGEEVAAIERSMRERLGVELVREREKIRADVEKEAALERESYRDELRSRADAEAARRIEELRRENARELAELETRVTELQSKLAEARSEAPARGDHERLLLELEGFRVALEAETDRSDSLEQALRVRFATDANTCVAGPADLEGPGLVPALADGPEIGQTRGEC